jgi:hypothetical protein
MAFGGVAKPTRTPNPFLAVGKELAEEDSSPFNGILKVLDYLGRPANAIAGATDAVVTGKFDKIFSNLGKGITAEKRFSFNTVLRHMGASKGPKVDVPFLGSVSTRGTAGLALDILTDPLSYIGIGTVTKAGRAVPRGLSQKGAEAVGTISKKFQDISRNTKHQLRNKKFSEIDETIKGIEQQGVKHFNPATGEFDLAHEGVFRVKKLKKPKKKVIPGERVADPVIKKVNAGSYVSKDGRFRIAKGEGGKWYWLDEVAGDGGGDLYKTKKQAEAALRDWVKNDINAKIVDTVEETNFGFTFDPVLKKKMQATGSQEVDGVFNKNVLPSLQERFKKELRLQRGGDDAGVFFRGKLIYSSKEAVQEIEDVIGLSSLLDEAMQFNTHNFQIIRNIENKTRGLRGHTLEAQASKGFRSLFTFGGVPIVEGIGKRFGLSDELLRKMDVAVFRGFDNVFDHMNDWSIVKQMREKLTNKTGWPLLDEMLVKFRGKEQFAAKGVLIQQLKIVEQSQIALKKNPQEVKRFMEKVIDAVETGDNTLVDGVMDTIDPDVRNVAMEIKAALDVEFKARKLSADSLNELLGPNLKVAYLDGYFPRELDENVKELFEKTLDNSPVKHGIFLTHEGGRKFRDLTTKEINTLFRENKLGLEVLEEAYKKDKKFRARLNAMDGELASFFQDDPVVAVINRLAAGAKVTAKRNQTASLLRIFGRPVTENTPLHASEAMVLPTGVFNTFDPAEFARPSRIRAEAKRVLGLPKNFNAKAMDGLIKGFKEVDYQQSLKYANKMEPAAEVLHTQSLFTELSMGNPNLFATLQNLGVPTYAADKKVVNLINKMWEMQRSPEAYSFAAKSWDAVTAIWKRYTLSIFPEFHARNFISDIGWLNNLAGINPIKESMHTNGAYVKAFHVFRQSEFYSVKGPKKYLKTTNPGRGLTIKTKAGTELPLDKEWQTFLEGGGAAGLFRETEFAVDKTLKHFTDTPKQQLKPGFRRANPLSPSFLPVQVGQDIGDGINVWSRFSHFLAKRKQGWNQDEAIMSVKKHLFDYSDLTNFERRTLRRVFPFYTWMRKNIPLQMEMLVRQPGKFANLDKAIRAAQDPDIEIPPGGVPEYIRKEWGIPTREVSPGVIEFQLLGSYIPAADLIKIGSPSEIARLGLKSLNPIIQAPAEDFFNKNFFSDLPVEQFPGEKGVFLDHAIPKSRINKLKKIRALNTLDFVIAGEDPNNPYKKKQFTKGEKIVKLLTGVKPTQIDTTRVQKRTILQSSRFASKLNASLDRAKKSGDKVLIDWLNDMLNESKALQKK